MLAVTIHGNRKHIRAAGRTGEWLLLAYVVHLILYSLPLKKAFGEGVS
jgi:hypothetical protein